MNIERVHKQLMDISQKRYIGQNLKKIYIEELSHLHKSISKLLKLNFLLFFGTALVTFIILLIFPEKINILMEKIAPAYNMDANPFTFKELIIIFARNLTACILSILFGLIPFIFIPAISCIRNGYALGLVLASIGSLKKNILLVFLTGVVPHGIFEIPVLLYSFSIGMYLCKKNTLHMIKKEKSEGYTSQIIKAFKFIVIPTLLVAALVETFVTPLLMKAFS